MKIPFIPLAFLAFIQVLASQSFQRPLAQTVYAKQSASSTFSAANDLFELMPVGGRSTITPDLPPEVRSYELLQIQEESLQQLIHQAPETFTLKLPGNGRSPLEVELVRVNIFSDNFKVRTSASVSPVEVKTGLYYRGIIKGDPESIAAFSIFDQEVRGLFSSATLGNLTLGRLTAAGRSSAAPGGYILYDDRALAAKQEFECGTPDDGPDYTPDELSYTATGRDANDCIRVYFEVDYDIYRDKGSVAAVTDYVTALFNEVAVLYANESINVVISELFIWNTASPYNGTNAGTLLSQFQNYRKSFDGDIGQLLSYQASGGIAVLSGLCHPYSWARLSFASIGRSFNTLPSYSFTVMVVTHELGHLLGSQHTHACVWNGNNTAIDGCAGFTEGNCPNPGKPAGGGTIMSYCHITSVGIDFSKGFGPQPGSVIRSKVSQSNCTQVCSTAPPSNGGGSSGGDSGSSGNATCNEIFLTLTLDDFGPETTWEIVDATNAVLHSGGPYAKKQAGTIIRETFCLPDGCYDFVIMDEDGDGICCDYGQGSFLLRDAANQTIASGGDFQYERAANFCLQNGANDGGGSDNNSCNYIDLTSVSIQSYGGSQDQGTHQLVNGGTVLKLENNSWKAIPMSYTITPNTVLEFEFLSTLEGEIHGIGFDDDNSISYALTFKVFGKQAWGRLEYDDYPGGGVWKKYSIPVGQFYTGDADRLFFACDNDSPPYDGNAFYRNIVIHEGGACGSQLPEPGTSSLAADELRPEGKAPFSVFPNPTSRELQIRLPASKAAGSGLIQIYNTTGQLIMEKEVEKEMTQSRLNLEDVTQGTYLIRYDNGVDSYTERFTILRE